jgi:hypothetical protein
VDLAPPQADIGQQAVVQLTELALGAGQGEEAADTLGQPGDGLGESAQGNTAALMNVVDGGARHRSSPCSSRRRALMLRRTIQ